MENKRLDSIIGQDSSLNKENLEKINEKIVNEEQNKVTNFDCIIGTSWNEAVNNFNEMNLKKELLKGIYDYGFNKPSTFQQKAIITSIKGYNIIAQAPYGSTKTTTSIISVLQQVDNELNEFQALILAPTRELACEISKKIITIGNYLKISCYLCIGGTSVYEDIKQLKNKQIVVGTTGRVLDMVNRSVLKSDYIKSIVLVEADEMIDRDFHSKIYDIHEKLNKKDLQIILQSATIPEHVLKLVNKIIKDPIHILIKDELLFEGIEQFYLPIEKEESKFEILCNIFDKLSNKVKQAVIFCGSRRNVEYLDKKMKDKNLNVSYLHGDVKNQELRDSIIQEFINGSTCFLITTDKLVLGIDIKQIPLVINYDLPKNYENYIHRVGRGQPYGRPYGSLAISFVNEKDKKILQDIEQHFKIQIKEMPLNLSNLI